MGWEQGIAIISILISLMSVSVTFYNSSKQREIDEKLQGNEFKYSRRKIWYDNQSEAIEQTLEILSLINKQLTDFKESFTWEYGDEQELLRYALIDGDKLRRIYHLNQVYFNKEMIFLIKRYITILDNISDNTFEYVVHRKEDAIDQELILRWIDSTEEIYYELLSLVNKKYLS